MSFLQAECEGIITSAAWRLAYDEAATKKNSCLLENEYVIVQHSHQLGIWKGTDQRGWWDGTRVVDATSERWVLLSCWGCGLGAR